MPKIGDDLQRILDVIQEDITKTTSESRRLLLRKLSFSASLSIAYGIDNQGNILEQDKKNKWSQFITLTSSPSAKIDEDNPIWLSYLQIRKEMISLLELIFKYTIEEDGGIISLTKIGGIKWSSETNFEEFSSLYTDESDSINLLFKAYRFPEEEQVQDEITIRRETHRLLDALVKIPVRNLKRCPECEKFFVQATKRERKFCSTKCRNKFNIKDKYIPLKDRK